MKTKQLISLLLILGTLVGGSKGIQALAHGGNNAGNVQTQTYLVKPLDGAVSSGFLTKKHNTPAIHNVTSIGGNKAIYGWIRYHRPSDKQMIDITNVYQLKSGQRTQLQYKSPANYYYGHSLDTKLKSGSTVWVDVTVKGSWSPDDKYSNCTM